MQHTLKYEVEQAKMTSSENSRKPHTVNPIRILSAFSTHDYSLPKRISNNLNRTTQLYGPST